MNSLNERVVQAALQDHIDAGRTPAEAAGEVRFLDEVMAEQGIVSKETAEETRRIVDNWLADILNVSPDDTHPELQLADEYTHYLRKRVVTKPNQMPMTETAWREWRQNRG